MVYFVPLEPCRYSSNACSTPLFADQRVQRVALFAVCVGLLGVNLADGAEQMRRRGRMELADGARLHDHARNAQLHHGSQIFRAHVACQRVVFKSDSGNRTQLQFIPDGNDLVGLLLRPVGRDAVARAELFS